MNSILCKKLIFVLILKGFTLHLKDLQRNLSEKIFKRFDLEASKLMTKTNTQLF